MPSNIKIFIAYSRKDSHFLEQLQTQLKPLERQDNIDIWYDGKIEPGVQWDEAINHHLHTADIILLLVSADAINSNYFYDVEMKGALRRHEEDMARVVPLIIRSCLWMATPLEKLQALPKNGKPVDTWLNRDEAYHDAVANLWKLVKVIEKENKRALLKAEQTEKQTELGKDTVTQTKSKPNKTSEKAVPGGVTIPEKKEDEKPIFWQHSFFWPLALGIVFTLFLFVVGGEYFAIGEQSETNIVESSPPSIGGKLPKEQARVNRDALKKEPSEDWEKKGDTAFNGRKYETAKKHYYKVSGYKNKPDILQKIRNCDKLAEQRKEQNYQKYLNTGDRYYNQGNFKEAKSGYEKAKLEKQTEEIQTKIEDCAKQLEILTILRAMEMNMVTIPSGSFDMGCTPGQGSDCNPDEKPIRRGVYMKSFKINKYEVTQEEWRIIMGADALRLKFKGCNKCPVESVSYNDVQNFIKKLNEKTGKKYRLPSEAEWEYAARGSQDYKYAGNNDVHRVAWYGNNSENQTRGVGSMQNGGNGYGLYDMSGNVWEWCQDVYYDSYKDATRNGQVRKGGSDSPRVVRGGGWDIASEYCRVTNRSKHPPDDPSDSLGFRLAHSL